MRKGRVGGSGAEEGVVQKGCINRRKRMKKRKIRE